MDDNSFCRDDDDPSLRLTAEGLVVITAVCNRYAMGANEIDWHPSFVASALHQL